MGMRFAGRRQYRAGGPFIARKVFAFAGVEYKTGDDFPIADIATRVVERLFRSNMIDMKPGEIEGGETERVVLDALPTMSDGELGNLLRHETDVRRSHYRRRLVEEINAEIARRAEPPQDAQEAPVTADDDPPAPNPFDVVEPDPLRSDAPVDPMASTSAIALAQAVRDAADAPADPEPEPDPDPEAKVEPDPEPPAPQPEAEPAAPTVEEAPKPPPIPAGSKLILMRKEALVELATAYQLSIEGTKADIVNRLNEARELLAGAEGA